MRSSNQDRVRRRRRGRAAGRARRARRGQAARRRVDRNARRSRAARSGGDRVDVTSLSRGVQDPHFVDAKPSLVLALNRADALVYVGPRSRDRLAAAAGAAGAQRAASSAGNPGTSTRRRRSVPKTSRTCRPISCARWATSTRSATRTTGSRPRTRARSRACSPSGSRRSTRTARPRTRRSSARFEAQLASKEKEWESRGGAAARDAHRHVPQELVVRGALARAGGGRLHRAQARHPAHGESHRAARRADEEVRRAPGRRRIVLPEHDGALRRRQRPAPGWSPRPSNVGATPAIKTYFDLVDAVIAALKGG